MTFTLNRPKIKICCISSLEEAFLAIKQGADALGLVGNMPSGPGVIADELISQIKKHVPPPIATFLLTSERKASDIIAHHQKVQIPYKLLIPYWKWTTPRLERPFQQ